MPAVNSHINYIEFKARDLIKIKAFYTKAFDWSFTDYGPDYTAFANSGIEGGFMRTDEIITHGALVVLYHDDLEGMLEKVKESGGTIAKEIFSFPGGRRFHFHDPSGNELAIWSDH
ncbi:VOC family protein [Robertkochia solimangrovi]|uniref:VOC family protein n=1 Tax=Robertkochia solimangrovi TaxID=2213046 RepID=UPI00117E3257|nr:VOC family protein [Robertkochia solimangrovi]TRZ46320.1 VOC family protein [Robertkochia solimangrovi]